MEYYSSKKVHHCWWFHKYPQLDPFHLISQSKFVLLSFIKNGLWPFMDKTTKAPLFKPLHLQQEHLIDLSTFFKKSPHLQFHNFSLPFGHTHTHTHQHNDDRDHRARRVVLCLACNRDNFFQHEITPVQ